MVHGAAGDIDNFIRGLQLTQLQAVEIVSWFVAQAWEGGPPPYPSSICQNLLPTTLPSLELNSDCPRSPETPPMRSVHHHRGHAFLLMTVYACWVSYSPAFDGSRLSSRVCDMIRHRPAVPVAVMT